jgi:hypothetical protein
VISLAARARRQRPSSRRTERHDELAPPHVEHAVYSLPEVTTGPLRLILPHAQPVAQHPSLSKGPPQANELHRARACAAFERAADSLHRARINTELLSNDAHTWPSRSRQSLPAALFHLQGYSRAPQTFALLLARESPARTRS